MSKIPKKLDADKELFRAPKFHVVEREFPNGKSTIICHPGAAVILPFIDSCRICMIINHRKTIDKNLIELPAGTLSSNEPPVETAKRELIEETGYSAKQITPLFDYFVSPGIMDEKMYAFLASELEPGHQNLMPDEEIEPIVVPFTTALNWIKTGKIQDAKTIATILYFEKFGQTFSTN